MEDYHPLEFEFNSHKLVPTMIGIVANTIVDLKPNIMWLVNL